MLIKAEQVLDEQMLGVAGAEQWQQPRKSPVREYTACGLWRQRLKRFAQDATLLGCFEREENNLENRRGQCRAGNRPIVLLEP